MFNGTKESMKHLGNLGREVNRKREPTGSSRVKNYNTWKLLKIIRQAKHDKDDDESINECEDRPREIILSEEQRGKKMKKQHTSDL